MTGLLSEFIARPGVEENAKRVNAKRVKSFVASCWFSVDRSLTQLAPDEIDHAELSKTSDA